MEFHKFANIFPLIEGQEFDNLVEDIKKNGLQQHTIHLYEGKILDGRNRYRACEKLKMLYDINYYDFSGTPEEAVNFVVSLNINRRHLTVFQKVEALKKAEEIKDIQKEAKEKQREAGKQYGRGQKKVLTTLAKPINTREEIVKKSKTSHGTVAKVNKILSKGTEKQQERARSGKSSINAVYKEIKRVERQSDIKKISLSKLEGKYNVFLADPPWQYDNKSTVISGVAEEHYPTMEIEKIKELPIKDMVLDKAVLFLWTTTAMIKKAFDVIEAWGFTFKTSMVWVKPRIGTGFYVRGKHEIILIATKGSFLPMTTALPESVFFADTGKHSEKPEIIYEIIEKMYPGQRYIELFHRGETRKDWQGWGYESGI